MEKLISKLFVAFVLLILLYCVVGLLFSMWPFSTVGGLVTKTTSSTAIITNYEWFYDQYGQIESMKSNYLSFDTTTTNKSKEMLERQQIERQGLKQCLNSSIAEYNSRSKMITRNMWKASDIPFRIDLIN